jgi:hypothetical protein
MQEEQHVVGSYLTLLPMVRIFFPYGVEVTARAEWEFVEISDNNSLVEGPRAVMDTEWPTQNRTRDEG